MTFEEWDKLCDGFEERLKTIIEQARSAENELVDIRIKRIEETIKAVKQEPCRESVIDAIANTIVNGESLGYGLAEEIVSEISSVTPKPYMSENPTGSNCSEKPNKWIPVSERFPEEDGCYLVTTTGTNNDIIDIAYYTEGIWHKASQIKAWMPLPEPYDESEDTE